ncbi:hypothetical protein D3C77_698390 [compost metagenome]
MGMTADNQIDALYLLCQLAVKRQAYMRHNNYKVRFTAQLADGIRNSMHRIKRFKA